jgi:hypothetical protein
LVAAVGDYKLNDARLILPETIRAPAQQAPKKLRWPLLRGPARN